MAEQGQTKRGVLTVLARGRLCNKLRVLLTAVNAARRTDRDVHIGWVPNPGCDMTFTDFFMPIDGLKTYGDEKEMTQLIYNSSVSVGDRDDIKGWDCGQNLFAITCGAIRCGTLGVDTSMRQIRNALKPKSEVTEAVAQYARDHFKQTTVGVHIRATEHFLELTPLGKFHSAIGKMIEGGAKVYLSTDSMPVVKEVKQRWGSSILYRDKVLGSDSKEGMAGAIIDLYLLNKCQKIYGTRTSSFNWMASIIDSDVGLVML